MGKKPKAGDLFYSVAFEKQSSSADGFGGRTASWSTQFACRAAYVHLHGGEAVQAARLESRHPQIITVRRSSLTAGVTAEWRIRDTRTEEIFAIRDVEPETNRGYISFLCEKGIAS